MSTPPLIFALVAGFATAVPATAFVAQNDLVVEPGGSDSFAIPYRGESGAPAFWCAAGDYVLRELGLPASTRIYRISEGPRRSGEGISFSLSADGAQHSGLAVFGNSDLGISANHARALCDVDEFPMRDDD